MRADVSGKLPRRVLGGLLPYETGSLQIDRDGVSLYRQGALSRTAEWARVRRVDIIQRPVVGHFIHIQLERWRRITFVPDDTAAARDALVRAAPKGLRIWFNGEKVHE